MKHLQLKLNQLDWKRPFKDNITQLKNLIEIIVADLVARNLPFLQTTLFVMFGDQVALEYLVVAGLIERVILYWCISILEYILKDENI
jgi:hypothetical protein